MLGLPATFTVGQKSGLGVFCPKKECVLLFGGCLYTTRVVVLFPTKNVFRRYLDKPDKDNLNLVKVSDLSSIIDFIFCVSVGD